MIIMTLYICTRTHGTKNQEVLVFYLIGHSSWNRKVRYTKSLGTNFLALNVVLRGMKNITLTLVIMNSFIHISLVPKKKVFILIYSGEDRVMCKSQGVWGHSYILLGALHGGYGIAQLLIVITATGVRHLWVCLLEPFWWPYLLEHVIGYNESSMKCFSYWYNGNKKNN